MQKRLQLVQTASGEPIEGFTGNVCNMPQNKEMKA